MTDVDAAIARSAADFERAVWPTLGPLMGGGELLAGETATDSPFAKALDVMGATDCWQLVQGGGIRALATRVQYDAGQPALWLTWTIRYRLWRGGVTEWQKLLDETCHRPNYFIQAYLSQVGGVLRAAAAIRVADLVRLMGEGCLWRMREAPDGNLFRVLEWDDAGDAEVIRYEAGSDLRPIGEFINRCHCDPAVDGLSARGPGDIDRRCECCGRLINPSAPELLAAP